MAAVKSDPKAGYLSSRRTACEFADRDRETESRGAELPLSTGDAQCRQCAIAVTW